MATKARVLVIGGGAREHAICWKLAQDGAEIHCAPGNGGISQIAKCHEVKVGDFEGLLALAREIKSHLIVVGPEVPLAEGIVNLFSVNDFRIVGPSAEAAHLEASKMFAKKFMWRHDIPTADCWFFNDQLAARGFVEDYKKNNRGQLVVKADGLAAGKGVIVPKSFEETLAALGEIKKFGEWFGLEKRLYGDECSFIVLADGGNIVPFLPATDYKRRNNGDEGPNTGGMGCHAPVPLFTPEMQEVVMKTIVLPTVRGMAEEGNRYQGFLYFGLMLTSYGPPMVLEFNCRLGDPETLPILALMKSNFFELLMASTTPDGLRGMKAEWSDEKAVTVVLADEKYPSGSSSGETITGIDQAGAMGAIVSHAGTMKLQSGNIATNGGRIIGVTGIGENFRRARETAYIGAECINFEGKYFRTDIAANLV